MRRCGWTTGLTLLVIGVGSAAACGSTERRQSTTHPGGSAGTAGDAPSTSGATTGGQPAGSGGQTTHAGSVSKAGNTTGGASAGAPPASAGASNGGDGGAAGAVSIAEGGAGGEPEGSAGAAGICSQTCKKESFNDHCNQNQNEASWVCTNGDDYQLFAGQCRSTVMGAIRFCCPPSFMSHCL